eukprot:1703888-Amphidinium_carterae.1
MTHRVIHHHFQLSGADLSKEIFIVQCKVDQAWIAGEGCQCINGYATSCNVKTMKVTEAKVQITGIIKILDSVTEFLNSPQ